MSADVFSGTTFSELAREAREVERWNRLHAAAPRRTSHLETLLPGREPVIAASDYVRAYPQLVAGYLDARCVTLGTDGFGRGSLLITTNKGIQDWPELLAGDEVLATAILDRLLHHSHVLNIKGRSYRLRDLEQAVSLRQ